MMSSEFVVVEAMATMASVYFVLSGVVLAGLVGMAVHLVR